ALLQQGVIHEPLLQGRRRIDVLDSTELKAEALEILLRQPGQCEVRCRHGRPRGGTMADETFKPGSEILDQAADRRLRDGVRTEAATQRQRPIDDEPVEIERMAHGARCRDRATARLWQEDEAPVTAKTPIELTEIVEAHFPCWQRTGDRGDLGL